MLTLLLGVKILLLLHQQLPSDFELEPFAIKMARFSPTKSCKNGVYGVVLHKNFVEYSQQSVYICVFVPCFQVPDSGNYTFYVSCDNWCELWKYDVDEFGMESWKKKAEENLTKKLIIALYAWTRHLEWNK